MQNFVLEYSERRVSPPSAEPLQKSIRKFCPVIFNSIKKSWQIQTKTVFRDDVGSDGTFSSKDRFGFDYLLWLAARKTSQVLSFSAIFGLKEKFLDIFVAYFGFQGAHW